MKKIYLVLSYTGTIPSKVIKLYTHKEYSHISISLDKELTEMYSFARLYKYIAFIGGFIHEHKSKGIYANHKNTNIKIYSINVTDKQYNKIKSMIEEFKSNSKKYRYNIIGFFFVPLHLRVKRKHHFYCAEFVKYLLEEANVYNDLPKIIKPYDFLEIEPKEIVYQGLLRNY